MKCAHCGNESNSNYYCPTCEYYMTRMSMMAENNGNLGYAKLIIAGGDIYLVKPMSSEPARYRGFGGTTFRFKMLSGEIVESNDCWSNGHVPENFKDLLPDNAVLIGTR